MHESNFISKAPEWVQRAQSGDTGAFESLVNLYERRVYNIAHRLMGNPADAEDVLQETFLKAFENLGQFRKEASFYTWIVQIAVNTALQKLNKQRKLPSQSLDEPGSGVEDYKPKEIAVWEETPESVYSKKEVREILDRVIASLPLIYRSVFLLADVEDLPMAEVSGMLGLSLAAAKSRLIRARLELRDRLSLHFKKQGTPAFSAEHEH
jgi:RNA polymerase sigma-70 factor (ECF subfamily)